MQINGKSELLSFIKKELSEKQVYLINVRKIGYSKYILEFEQVWPISMLIFINYKIKAIIPHDSPQSSGAQRKILILNIFTEA